MKNIKTLNMTLAILKPDFFEQNLSDEFLQLLKINNLTVESTSKIKMDLSFVKKLYQWDIIDFPEAITEYLCKNEMKVLYIEGPEAIKKLLSIKKLLREKHQSDTLHTIIHCPDSEDDYIHESNLLISNAGDTFKTNLQVEVILYRETKKRDEYLLLKRSLNRGGFWQPVTGNIMLGEKPSIAALRELKEELSISKIIQLIDLDFSFSFEDDFRNQTEKVFAVEVDCSTSIILSDEHTDFKWVSSSEAISNYLIHDGNKDALKELVLRREKVHEVRNYVREKLTHVPELSDYISDATILLNIYKNSKMWDIMILIDDGLFEFEFLSLYSEHFVVDDHDHKPIVFTRIKSYKWFFQNISSRLAVGLWIFERSMIIQNPKGKITSLLEDLDQKHRDSLPELIRRKYIELRTDRHNLRSSLKQGEYAGTQLAKFSVVKLFFELMLLSKGEHYPFKVYLPSEVSKKLTGGDKYVTVVNDFLKSNNSEEIIASSDIMISFLKDNLIGEYGCSKHFLEKWWLNL